MIPLCVPELQGREWDYVKECLDTNFVSSVGAFVGRFEAEFAEFTGVAHGVACSTGTAAIHLALRVAGVERDDEVLVSGFTFIASINPILYQGAIPVLVDAESRSWNIDPDLVVAELDRRARAGVRQVKAVVVAHLLGAPADLAPIVSACRRHGVVLIEDAAESLGATYTEGPFAGRQVGSIGDLGCFSFNGNKIITTGGGGMVVTADAERARRARHLSTQAKIAGTEYVHDEVGYNYRLTNVAAAMGVAQLERLPDYLLRKAAIARRYSEELDGISGVTVAPSVPWGRSTFWMYSILIDPDRTGLDRRIVLDRLEGEGIQTRPVWAPAHLMAPYSSLPRLGGAVGERLFAQGLSLPCSVGLTADDQARVIVNLTRLLRQRE